MIDAPTEIDLAEARNKLQTYADDYGEDILTMTPDDAYARAAGIRQASRNHSPPQSLDMLCEAVHFESIARYLQTLR